MLIAVAALTAAPERTPPIAASVIILSPEMNRSQAQDRNYLIRRTNELLVTMHDVGLIRYEIAEFDRAVIDRCVTATAPDGGDNETPRARCIGEALSAHAGRPVVAVVIENMRWHSAAQQMTCISPGAKSVERTPIHLRDIFHRYVNIRAGNRVVAKACLEAALGKGE